YASREYTSMSNQKSYRLGIMFRREHAPEQLPEFARKAERAGFDELWVVEDCFFGSGIASAAVALACTESIAVGLGIMPAVVRNPVFAAMEIATLARLYPGRFLPGFGHGVASWMRQIGAFPQSQLNALEEVTTTVRDLLAGNDVTFSGQHVRLDQAKLVHPPDRVPPIALGVIGPKSLALSGRVADGTILGEYSAPAYVAAAREQIARGQREAGQNREHRLTVFAFACAGDSSAAARQTLRPMVAAALASGDLDSRLAAMGILPEVRDIREAGGQERLEAAMPADWIEQLTIAGTREDWSAAIDRLVEAGADSIVLVPLPDAPPEEIDAFARHVLA
ncbi:MAG TPA: LLM class flavin-dependent oxidoreductase, partial [Roseiflexaceae bacterium]|nr:LLM class flavin-dependent oxidoreductase [Roseiflexaceae bacterium]